MSFTNVLITNLLLILKKMDKIVFIGLGKMGLPMAENLRASGLDVIGYDINKSARNTFSGVSFDEVKEALSNAETVITMLPVGRK